MEKSKTSEQADNAEAATSLTLEDLLASESEVLKRVARDQLLNQTNASGHYSSTSGHNMSGSHSSHTMAKVERPLDSDECEPEQ